MSSRDKREERKSKVVSARKRVEQHEAGGGLSTLKLPSGCNLFQVKQAGPKRFDIIPYTVGKGNPFSDPGEMYFERTYYTHRGIGPNNESVVCMYKTFKKPCFICEHRGKLAKDPDTDEKVIKELAPKERQLFNVFDHKDKDRGVQIFENSFHTFGKMLDEYIKNADEEDHYEYFADPKRGSTLKVGFSEEKMGGYSFLKASSFEFKLRTEPLDSELLEKAYCLDDLIRQPTYEEVKKLMLQTGDGDDDENEDEDEDEKPKGKVKANKPSKNGDDDEDEDEDDKPAKTGKGKLKVGDLVMYKGNECEITKITPDGKTFTIEDEDGEDYRVKDASQLTPVTVKGKEVEDDEDEDDKTKAKRGKKAVAKKDDEDEDDEEEDDQDETEEDEDNSEDDEDDEEDEVKPAAKKPAAKRGKK